MLKHTDISSGSCLNKLSSLILWSFSISESSLESCLEAVTILTCLWLNMGGCWYACDRNMALDTFVFLDPWI